MDDVTKVRSKFWNVNTTKKKRSKAKMTPSSLPIQKLAATQFLAVDF
jgi:hypothetical protein